MTHSICGGLKMLSVKRVVIATTCGIFFGLICLYLAISNPETSDSITTNVKINILFSRALIGFIIGISALRLSWWIHGITIGIIASVPLAFLVMDKTNIFISTFVLGIIYGFLTELLTTVIFKAKSAGILKATE